MQKYFILIGKSSNILLDIKKYPKDIQMCIYIKKYPIDMKMNNYIKKSNRYKKLLSSFSYRYLNF